MHIEIEKHGEINELLNFEFKKIKSSLRVKVSEKLKTLPLTYARVEFENKFTQVYLSKDRGMYLPDFWRDGVCLATGATAEINELVKVIDFWLLNEVSTSVLAENFSIVKPNIKAKAFDDNKEVEYTWNLYLKNESHSELKEFIKLAKEDVVVGKLFPFMSLVSVCFSRCTGYPYTNDTPFVIPIAFERNRYEVRTSKGVVIGRGTANEALKILKDNLPKDIKPAVKGTADDL